VLDPDGDLWSDDPISVRCDFRVDIPQGECRQFFVGITAFLVQEEKVVSRRMFSGDYTCGTTGMSGGGEKGGLSPKVGGSHEIWWVLYGIPLDGVQVL